MRFKKIFLTTFFIVATSLVSTIYLGFSFENVVLFTVDSPSLTELFYQSFIENYVFGILMVLLIAVTFSLLYGEGYNKITVDEPLGVNYEEDTGY